MMGVTALEWRVINEQMAKLHDSHLYNLNLYTHKNKTPIRSVVGSNCPKGVPSIHLLFKTVITPGSV